MGKKKPIAYSLGWAGHHWRVGLCCPTPSGRKWFIHSIRCEVGSRGIEACVERLSVCELSFPPCSFLNYKRKWCPVRGLPLLTPGARLYLKSARIPWPPACRGANVSFAVHLGPHQSAWSTFLSPSGDSFALQIPFVVWLGRSRAEIARAEPCCLWVESKPVHFVS